MGPRSEAGKGSLVLQTQAPSQLEFVLRLPRVQCVDRVEFLLSQARGKRVIHLGFVDSGCLHERREAGDWLHDQLHSCALSLVGIDRDAEGVKWAQDAGLTAATADCTDASQVTSLALDPADLVIAGELIEHVYDAGAFLNSIRSLVGPGGKLILTTPNCCSIKGPLAALVGYEIGHPDHVAVYSYHTLRTLLARHDWRVTETYTYGVSGLVERDRQFKRRVLHAMLIWVLKAERFVARWRPFVADGLIVVCRPESATAG